MKQYKIRERLTEAMLCDPGKTIPKSTIKLRASLEKAMQDLVRIAYVDGWNGGREWMHQGREYAQGFRDGLSRAFDFFEQQKDERFLVLSREVLYPEEGIKESS